MKKYTEAVLKSELMKLGRLRLPHYVFERHEDKLTSGIPDMSVDGNHTTTWWEFKMANPEFASTGIQELTMIRKSDASHYAAYVIYDVVGNQTLIVHPRLIRNWRTTDHRVKGIDHEWVIAFIRKIHES